MKVQKPTATLAGSNNSNITASSANNKANKKSKNSKKLDDVSAKEALVAKMETKPKIDSEEVKEEIDLRKSTLDREMERG